MTDPGQMPMNARQLFEPMLCESGDTSDSSLQELTDSGDYLFQPKYDGQRVMGFKGKNRYFIFNRAGVEVTHRYPDILDKFELCPPGSMIDGEIVVLDEETGRPDFNRLQQRMNLDDNKQIFTQSVVNPVTLIVFDVVGLSGQLINTQTLEERLILLDRLPLDKARTEEDGVALYEELVAAGWEGVVAKRKDSQYEIGARSGNWLKFKQA